MILSFHPCFNADHNIICAGRNPTAQDLAAIKAAKAVILSQGCTKHLYRMATENCAHVFPCYDARFAYPGKIGDIQLFRKHRVPHPKTEWYEDLGEFIGRHGSDLDIPIFADYPFVFKFDWGGEGDNIYLIASDKDLNGVFLKAENFERTGQKGFVIQEYIPSDNRTLRVVVIGKKTFSYWRVQNKQDAFPINLSKGARLNFENDPDLQHAAVESATDFCSQTKINLAGFDFLFSSETDRGRPLFLEINYFFGRRGLGGSQIYYNLLEEGINNWLNDLGLPNIRQIE